MSPSPQVPTQIFLLLSGQIFSHSLSFLPSPESHIWFILVNMMISSSIHFTADDRVWFFMSKINHPHGMFSLLIDLLVGPQPIPWLGYCEYAQLSKGMKRFLFIYLFIYLETGFLCVALAILELTL